MQVARARLQLMLTVTSYNPDTHSVKGTLQPYGIESGWMPIGTLGIGSGFGIAVGPNIGDQFDVDFHNGDPHCPRATHRVFSNKDRPPVAQSGEVVIQAATGQKITMTQDGNMLIQGPGNVTVQATGTLALQGATVNIN